jgi:hypothetical protein
VADPVHVTRDPNQKEVAEEVPVEPPIEEASRMRRLVLADGRKYTNTDAVPTQPLRCIRIP